MGDVNPNDCTLNNTCAPASAISPAGFPTDEVDNMGYRFWLTLVILVICSGLSVATRIATRLKMKQIGADDYFVLAAMVREEDITPICMLWMAVTCSRYHCSRSPHSGRMPCAKDTDRTISVSTPSSGKNS